ncbi:MAG: hypothetical protein HOG49_16570 [Candidatus Scalindua sp.]|nr:hypothetical protein [Candidatus Scalindua sp.]
MVDWRIVIKINVIAVNQNRDQHENTFIRYIEILKEHYKEDHDIKYFISEGHHFEFNKAKLLNKAIAEMRQDFDVLCVFDIDMIYSYQFFSAIEEALYEGCNYIVSYGQKLPKDQSDYIVENMQKCFRGEGSLFKGCSQITITKEVLQIFKDCFGEKFYDESYTGWGGEDSDISFKSKLLEEKILIKRKELFDMWFHLWHESREPENYREKDGNSTKFQDSKDVLREKVDKYVS